MFGENLGLDYYRQRHAELVQKSERARLVRCLETVQRAQKGQSGRVSLHRRMLAATGGQLVRLGSRLQGSGV